LRTTTSAKSVGMAFNPDSLDVGSKIEWKLSGVIYEVESVFPPLKPTEWDLRVVESGRGNHGPPLDTHITYGRDTMSQDQWIPRILCPKCEASDISQGDYLCEGCRYGM
jgi:hypothetical protein